MNLFKLGLLNLKKRLYDNSIIFLVITFTIMLFYIFNSIEYQYSNIISNGLEKTKLELFSRIAGYISIFMSIILGGFIIYSNYYIIKRRKKEFFTYSILGIKKTFFYLTITIETFVTGLISLFFGLILGIFFSQIMTGFISVLFDTNIEQFRFVFSEKAVLKTVFYYFLIFLISLLFSIIYVYSTNINGLINENEGNQKIGNSLNRLPLKFIILTFVFLGITYFKLINNSLLNFGITELFLYVMFGILGTIFFYKSYFWIFLKLSKYNKKKINSGINLFTYLEVSILINRNTFVLSIISVFQSISIIIIILCFSMLNYLSYNNNNLSYYDISIIDTNKNNEGKESIAERIKKFYPEVYNDFGKTIEFTYYSTDIIDAKKIDENKEKHGIKALTISDYNKINIGSGKDELSLNENEIFILYNEIKDREKIEKVVKPNEFIGKFKVKDIKMDNFGHYLLDSYLYGVVLIIPDSQKNGLKDKENAFIASLNGEKTYLQEKITKLMPSHFNTTYSDESEEVIRKKDPLFGLKLYSQTYYYIQIKGSYAAIVLISFYIVLSLLTVCFGVQFLQILCEVNDKKDNYSIFYNLGYDYKIINSSVLTQINSYIMAPLFLALSNSLVVIFSIRERILEYYYLANYVSFKNIVPIVFMISLVFLCNYTFTYLRAIKIIRK